MAKGKDKKSANGQDYAILHEPVVTEKSSMLGGGEGLVVAFKVDTKASKPQIKTAVENVFAVKVQKVRTSNFLGKMKRTTRSIGRRAAFKKAYVTLMPGETIDVVDGL